MQDGGPLRAIGGQSNTCSGTQLTGERLDLLNNKLKGYVGRIPEAEEHISNIEDTVKAKSEQLLQMDKNLKIIANKNEDLEARSRRNNLCIVSIPESTDTRLMEQYVERLLTTLFGTEAYSKILVVERAHRSLAKRPPPGAPPRPIITRLLNYRDRYTTVRLGKNATLYGSTVMRYRSTQTSR
ncbi:hypothetical protein NDU88_001602 [Pleurodeles waltl]|uniref:Uncharacterized protein n=1 Tax=Pleurodeles waltl TaxID=8319 RepID=A0AAV7LLZ7_PLEWA|nr:hypothetical protein NDU88_001602 [Pleurodeles waltl]